MKYENSYKISHQIRYFDRLGKRQTEGDHERLSWSRDECQIMSFCSLRLRVYLPVWCCVHCFVFVFQVLCLCCRFCNSVSRFVFML